MVFDGYYIRIDQEENIHYRPDYSYGDPRYYDSPLEGRVDTTECTGYLVLTNEDEFEWRGDFEILEDIESYGKESDADNKHIERLVDLNKFKALDLPDAIYEIADKRGLLEKHSELESLIDELANVIDDADVRSIIEGSFQEEYMDVIRKIKKLNVMDIFEENL